jgi:hypothetical protein
MWIFTKHGFISVVEAFETPDILVVRSRVAADIEKISASYFNHQVILYDANRDYPYRFFVPKMAFASSAYDIVMDIDYKNFKSMIHEQNEPVRDEAYGEVWRILHGLEELNPAQEQRK